MSERRRRIFSAPGKLVVAGEYGVVEGKPAVVVAVDRRARIFVEAAQTWSFAAGPGATPVAISEASSFVRACFERVEAVCGLPGPCAVTADTRAFAGAGGKYGLGSSAAVSVALVTALLALCGRRERDLVFQVALAAHQQAQGGGSGIDVAASVVGGALLYAPPARLELVPIPPGGELVVAWSGASASTQDLVSAVASFWRDRPDRRVAFLSQSEGCAEAVASGLRAGRWEEVAAALRSNQLLLVELGAEAEAGIDTPGLRRLVEAAARVHGAAKISGAGGGDCALSLAPVEVARRIRQEWSAQGLAVLDLAIDPRGAAEELGAEPDLAPATSTRGDRMYLTD